MGDVDMEIPAGQGQPQTPEQAYQGLLELYRTNAVQRVPVKEPNTATSCEDEFLVAAMTEGKVDARGTLGMRFDRFLAGDSVARKAYLSTRGREMKAKFRLEWAKKQYDSLVQEKVEIAQKSHTDISKGTYEPFSVIVDKDAGKAGQGFKRKRSQGRQTKFNKINEIQRVMLNLLSFTGGVALFRAPEAVRRCDPLPRCGRAQHHPSRGGRKWPGWPVALFPAPFLCGTNKKSLHFWQDDPAAVLAATNYSRKCVGLGPPWVKFNVMTERLEFLYMKEGVKDAMTRAWELRTTEKNNTDRPAAKMAVAAVVMR
jgi:hypothetical protein